jgi:chondroitin AC lyase
LPLKIIFSAIAAALFAIVSIVNGQTTVDIDTLVSRLKTQYLSSIGTGSAASYLSSQSTDGSWSTIDYASTSITVWPPNNHVSRIKTMAAAYNTGSHALYHSDSLLQGIVRGLAYWYARAPKSDNWWYNDIGKQLELQPIGILMASYVPQNLLDSIINTMQTAPSMTGENRVWISGNVVVRGCLEKNVNRVTTGLSGIEETIVITQSEGVQCDYSFYQHGAMLYNSGYGLGFINDNTNWAYLTRGTGFAFSSAQVGILSDLMLAGDQWMVRGPMMDFSVGGREISRSGAGTHALSLTGSLDKLAVIDPAKSAAYLAMKDHINGKRAPGITGNRQFWRGDFMTHVRPTYYASVKMLSGRTLGSECINSENLKGYWLCMGVNFCARRGDEYKDIFPVWDWTKIPGVTNPSVVPAFSGSTKHASPFVGSVSDGEHGAAAMVLNRDSTKAKKSWFFFDDEYAALGCGISSTSSNPVSTTINQCLQTGDAVSNGTVVKDSQTVSNVSWVWHDSVGYLFTPAATVKISARSQSGTWQSINTSQASTVINKNVFTLWIDHAIKPAAASYAYVVVPAITQAAIVSYAAKPPLTVVSNGDSTQAVYHSQLKVGEMIFYAAGSVTLRQGLSINVDKPCMALIDESKDSVIVAAGYPDSTVKSLSMTMTMKRAFGSDTTIQASIFLPTGQYCGSSVVKKIFVPNLNTAARERTPENLKNGLTVLLSGRRSGASIMVRFSESGSYRLALVNTAGKILYKADCEQVQQWYCPTAGLADGVYRLSITGSTCNRTFPLVLCR